jgi:hypothetical protein
MGYFDNVAWLETNHIQPLHLLSLGGICVYSQLLPLSVIHDTVVVSILTQNLVVSVLGDLLRKPLSDFPFHHTYPSLYTDECWMDQSILLK